MKQIFSIAKHLGCRWAVLTATLLLIACGQEELSSEAVDGGETDVAMTLQVNTAAFVPGKDALITYPDGLVGTQHVSTVYLLIFEGTGPEAVYTGYAKNVGWKEYFKEGLPIHSDQMTYHLQYNFTRDYPYTLLGVGFEEGGDLARNFPESLTAGMPLSELSATLTDASNVEELHRSEIFVGQLEYVYKKGSGPKIIELYRRVAGVMGSFKGVPHIISIGGKTVNELRLSLYAPQNTALPLLKRRQSPYFEDFIYSPTTATDGHVISRIAIPDGVKMEEVFTTGAYVLPMAAPADRKNYTLMVELVHLEQGKPEVLKSIRVKLGQGDELNHGSTGGGTGIIDTESAYRFPLIANHFYGMGTEKAPIDLKGHGEEITIYVDPSWKEDNDLHLTE